MLIGFRFMLIALLFIFVVVTVLGCLGLEGEEDEDGTTIGLSSVCACHCHGWIQICDMVVCCRYVDLVNQRDQCKVARIGRLSHEMVPPVRLRPAGDI